MKGDFSGLEFLLCIVQGESRWADLGQSLYCVWFIIIDIDGGVDYTVGADAQDFDEL